MTQLCSLVVYGIEATACFPSLVRDRCVFPITCSMPLRVSHHWSETLRVSHHWSEATACFPSLVRGRCVFPITGPRPLRVVYHWSEAAACFKLLVRGRFVFPITCPKPLRVSHHWSVAAACFPSLVQGRCVFQITGPLQYIASSAKWSLRVRALVRRVVRVYRVKNTVLVKLPRCYRRIYQYFLASSCRLM